MSCLTDFVVTFSLFVDAVSASPRMSDSLPTEFSLNIKARRVRQARAALSVCLPQILVDIAKIFKDKSMITKGGRVEKVHLSTAALVLGVGLSAQLIQLCDRREIVIIE